MLLQASCIYILFVYLNTSGTFTYQCLYKLLPSPGQFVPSLFTWEHFGSPSNPAQICNYLLKCTWHWLIAIIYQNKSKSLSEEEKGKERRKEGERSRERERSGEGEREREKATLKYKSLNPQINDFYHADTHISKKEIQCHRNEHIVARLDSSTIVSLICYDRKLDFGARQSVVESRVWYFLIMGTQATYIIFLLFP